VSHLLSHTACLKSSVSVGNETVIDMTAILGYARVSPTGQDLDAQLTALTATGVAADRIFTDKLSSAVKTARPGLAAMLDYARAGDTIVVAAIDRFGRSVAEVTRTIAQLGERRIILRVLREGIDTATPTGRAVAAIMATLAELELELARERRASSGESRRARCLPVTKPTKLSRSARSSCAASSAPANRSVNLPQRSESDGRPHTSTYPNSPSSARRQESSDRESRRCHQSAPRVAQRSRYFATVARAAEVV
jgi:hypothetical protein